MKKSFLLFLVWAMLMACTTPNSEQNAAVDASPVESPKNVLLHQLKTTHAEKEWFVPINAALEGVTVEQAMWNDNSGNHSVGQLAHHLLFWNKRQLAKINGQPEGEFSGNNDETFTKFNEAEWSHVVTELDSVLTAFENAVQNADEAKLKEWYPTIANISAHNAYHTGQIIFVRKLQKSWVPEKGVK
ncbi:MAG TPA: DinB family protein [Chryseolinea sp.]|nr:DinB family protein [Chryseolinea sp.]